MCEASVEIVLASASPRREELLRRVVREFAVVPSGFEEPRLGRPAARALAAARGKARDVAARRNGLVLGADTIVVLGRSALGKPASLEEARGMLGRLSGRTHSVITGMCIVDTRTGLERSAVEKTRVHFRRLSESEISRYLDTGEHEDKAGAYAIQGRAATFVDWIRGDYTNVMGLPVARLTLLLRELGADV
jgi:septum formation protein